MTAPEINQVTLCIAAKTPKHDQIQVRYLPSTAKRGDRVKMIYKARGKSLTVAYDTAIGDFEMQAIGHLIETGCVVASMHTPDEGPTVLSIPQESRPVLATVFKIKSF